MADLELLDNANDSTTAYGEGYQAYWENEEETSNPYAAGTATARDWTAGWRAARSDNSEDEQDFGGATGERA